MADAHDEFAQQVVKEVPIGSRTVGIGRSPDNDFAGGNLRRVELPTSGVRGKQAAGCGTELASLTHRRQ